MVKVRTAYTIFSIIICSLFHFLIQLPLLFLLSLPAACSGKYVPPNPTIVPKCYVMEGALTVYFPENYDYKKLLPSSQLLVLNTLKEGMEFGTMAQMAHPAILG